MALSHLSCQSLMTIEELDSVHRSADARSMSILILRKDGMQQMF
jgi:hypothetical protein